MPRPSVTKPLKSSNLIKSTKSYSIYSDTTRESFINRMQESGLVAKFARELNVKYHTALNWWHIYEETEGVPYKNSEKNHWSKKLIYNCNITSTLPSYLAKTPRYLWTI